MALSAIFKLHSDQAASQQGQWEMGKILEVGALSSGNRGQAVLLLRTLQILLLQC